MKKRIIKNTENKQKKRTVRNAKIYDLLVKGGNSRLVLKLLSFNPSL